MFGTSKISSLCASRAAETLFSDQDKNQAFQQIHNRKPYESRAVYGPRCPHSSIMNGSRKSGRVGNGSAIRVLRGSCGTDLFAQLVTQICHVGFALHLAATFIMRLRHKPMALHTFPTKRALPAWVSSLILHVLLVTLCGLLIPLPAPTKLSPQERVGRIVLATVSTANTPEYFDGSQQNQVANTQTAPQATSPLPPLENKPLPNLPSLALPGPAASEIDRDDLLPSLSLKSSRRGQFLSTEGNDAILAEDALRQNAGQFSGPPGEVSLFGSPHAVGRRFVFVIDRSKSMGDDGLGALTAAQLELTAALDRLEPTHQFEIVAYHHKTVFLGEKQLLPATPENTSRLSRFFNNLAAFGKTDHARGLLAACHLRPDAIFLLTDAGDPSPNPLQMRTILQTCAGRTSIHCIQFGFNQAPSQPGFMRKLASQTGGSYTFYALHP